MADLRNRGPMPTAPARRAPDVGDGPDEKIATAFRRFRESVVRLVEQVNDELSPVGDLADRAQRDLRLVRSAFGKWSAELLVALHATPAAGFEDLRRTLRGISARVLSLKLKELEEAGMVRREVLDTHPPRVHYSLTERGWTIAWLAQPIFLYMRLTEKPKPPEDAAANGEELSSSGGGPAQLPAVASDEASDAGASLRSAPSRTPARRRERRAPR